MMVKSHNQMLQALLCIKAKIQTHKYVAKSYKFHYCIAQNFDVTQFDESNMSQSLTSKTLTN